MANNTINHKSEILFLYDTTYNIPNGDPFTGEQRYDEETKKILISDVRIKRYVRDFLDDKEEDIYVIGGKSFAEGDESGSAARIRSLHEKFKKEMEEAEKAAKEKKEKFSKALFVMKKCVDVRLFGGIATGKGDAVNLTGPVQFALLNPSLNQTNLRMHQNTSVFVSKSSNEQGAIATTTVVPYSVVQIHGWLNPKVAAETGMTEDDLKQLFKSLWYGTSGDGSSHSRTKSGQNSILLIEIVYTETNKKVYGVDQLIKLNNKDNKKDEQLRSLDDFEFDFSKLIELAKSDRISKIKYYTELGNIKEKLVPKIEETDKENGEIKEDSTWKEKFEEIQFSVTQNKPDSNESFSTND